VSSSLGSGGGSAFDVTRGFTTTQSYSRTSSFSFSF
jgi:hypothetical protein